MIFLNPAIRFWMANFFDRLQIDNLRLGKSNGMKKLLLAFPAILLILSSCGGSRQASTGLSETEVTSLVNGKDFYFRAEQMLPQGGKTRVLTESYSFKVTPSQLVSDLPYMGRAFTANMGSGDGGMRFTSKDFTYQQNPGKNNGWNVYIYPKDQHDVRECILNIFSNGRADLLINSNNRQQIRYNGYVMANKSN